MDWLAAILAGLKALATLLGLIQAEQEREAGKNEIKTTDAVADEVAQRKISTIATQGQTDAQTISDLHDGSF
jgi:hypothetical protein